VNVVWPAVAVNVETFRAFDPAEIVHDLSADKSYDVPLIDNVRVVGTGVYPNAPVTSADNNVIAPVRVLNDVTPKTTFDQLNVDPSVVKNLPEFPV